MTVLASSSLAMLLVPAQAIEPDFYCFMVADADSVINLQPLYDPEPFVNSKRLSATQAGGSQGPLATKPRLPLGELIGQGVYKWGDSYCLSRARGDIGIDSQQKAGESVTSWVMGPIASLYGLDTAS